MSSVPHLPTGLGGTRLPARALLLVLTVALSGVFAQAVRADEPLALPLARLNPEEQTVLRRKIPGVDALPREKQEQIVRNVEWLRSLDPERRALVLRRLHDAQEARLGGQKLDDRMLGLKDIGKREPIAIQQGLAIRGLGRLAWRDLPPEIRDDPRVRALGERVLAVAFHRKFWHRAFQGLDAEAARAYEPPADAPQELRDRLANLGRQAQVETDPKAREKALWRLKEAVFQTRAFEVVRAAGADAVPPAAGSPRGPRHDDDARLVALGERLRDLARPAYDATLADLVKRWEEKGAEAWVGMVNDAAQPAAPPPEVRRKLEALQVAVTIESWNGFLAQHPALAAPADALLKAALVDDLGMSAEEFAKLPPRGDPAAQELRAEAFRLWLDQRPPLPREWIRDRIGRRLGGGFGAGGNDRPGWAPGRARPPGGRAPGAPGVPGVPPPGPVAPGEPAGKPTK